MISSSSVRGSQSMARKRKTTSKGIHNAAAAGSSSSLEAAVVIFPDPAAPCPSENGEHTAESSPGALHEGMGLSTNFTMLIEGQLFVIFGGIEHKAVDATSCVDVSVEA
mmetsp:Transcript_26419/g.62817  ORF Transcript_26419/g.62817 Transcript_26419/m.62817 type:complete len:109 (+) Transcript_26419:291-617(+)